MNMLGATPWGSLCAIGCGATLGAWLRWGLSERFNATLSWMPLGTWLANAIGGLLIGLALGYFEHHPGLNVAWRLFLITGFLGALTTFSTFSAEVTTRLLNGALLQCFMIACAHLAASLLMTALGLWLMGALRT